MKKIILVLMTVMLLTGCKQMGKSEVLKNINKNINNMKSYYIEGEMKVINGEDMYTYDVSVSYKDDKYYKVSLKNKVNNHEQVILKNDSGTYVVTPSLNRSFKFDSDWPSTNSQVYLPESILMDLNNDNDLKFIDENGKYKFTCKVNYPNNKRLTIQNVYIDKDFNLISVEVMDESSNKIIEMKYNKFEKNKSFDSNYFNLDNVKTNELDETTTKIDNAVFPMFLPDNTSLESQDTITYDGGERLILTFGGDNPFVLIEETITANEEFEVIPTIGDPVLLADTIGVMSDNSISWISNGLEYYIVSDVMGSDILDIANSMGAIPVMK